MNVFTNEVQIAIADQSAGKEPGFTENLKTVADSEHKPAAFGKLLDRIHHRRKTRERAGAQIVAVRKTAGKDHRVVSRKICFTVPDEVDRLAHVFRDHVIGIVVAIRTGKTITPNFTLLSPRGSLRLSGWKELRAPSSRLIRGRFLLIHASVERDFEVFALPDVGNSGEPEQLDRMLDGLALRVEHAGLQVYINFGFHLLPAALKINKALLKKQLLE